jgi:hypothetical protein
MPYNILAPTQYLYVGIKSCEYEMYSWSAIKLFCKCCCLGGHDVMLYSPLHSRPWIGRIQDELQVNSDKFPRG